MGAIQLALTRRREWRHVPSLLDDRIHTVSGYHTVSTYEINIVIVEGHDTRARLRKTTNALRRASIFTASESPSIHILERDRVHEEDY